MAIDEAILDKIRRIHALAENAGTEAEAALAAQRVAELCRKHNLEIGVATLTKEETEASEAVDTCVSLQWQTHWSYLMQATALLFDCGYYRNKTNLPVKQNGTVVGSEPRSTVHFYGLKANVQSALLTYQYLLASVESMIEGHLRTGNRLNGRADFRSFRLGCGARILAEAQNVSTQAKAAIAGSAECTALVRLGNQLIAAHATKLRLKGKARSFSFGDQNAYSAGYAAGGRVDLHGARTSRMLA